MRTKSLTSLAGLLLGAFLLGLPEPGHAQVCQINLGNMANSGISALRNGTVYTLGDLKIRIAKIPGSWGAQTYTFDWVDVDLKAPGFSMNGVHLLQRQVQKFAVCDAELSLNLEGYNVYLGVF